MNHLTIRFCYKDDDTSALLCFIDHLLSFSASNFKVDAADIFA